MDKNLFVCYSREDYEFIASFELEFLNFFKDSNNIYQENLKLHLKIDRSSSVTRLGDEFKINLEQAIEESDGALIFISKNTSMSKFINEIEIPKILEVKNKKPNYFIVPVFIDDVDDVNSTIMSFHAPNSQNSTLRDMPGDMKSFTYKSLINDLVQSFVEVGKNEEKKAREERLIQEEKDKNFADTGIYETNAEKQTRELELIEEYDQSIGLLKKKESRKTTRNFGFLLILIGGIIYNFLIPSQTTQLKSCETFDFHYEDLASIYDEQVYEQFQKSRGVWKSFVDNQLDSDDYWALDSSSQKNLHQEIKLEEIPYTLSILEESLVKFQAEGLGDIDEEHVEMKKELLVVENLLISLIETRMKILLTQIEFIDLIENYFEDWDRADTKEAKEDADYRFNQMDQQNNERFAELFETFDSLDEQFATAKVTYFNTYNTLCRDSNI